MEIRYRHSIALVKDIETSKKFYNEVIGLPIVQEYDAFVLFQDQFAIHQAELFYEYIKKPYSGEKLGHDNVDFYFTTSDLDEMQNKLKENGVTFLHEIHRHDWGERVIRIYDPDNHILEIGDAHQQ